MTARSFTVRRAWRVATLLAAAGLAAACSNASPSTASSPAPRSTPRPTPVVAATPVVSPASVQALSTAPATACPSNPDDSSCLAAGTYLLSPDVVATQTTINVPGGWFEWHPGRGSQGLLVDGGKDAPGGSGWGILFLSVDKVSVNPCDASKGTFQPTAVNTVDGLVSAISSWPGFETSAPQSITVGGHPGKLVEVAATVTAARCANPVLWTMSGGGILDGYPIVNVQPKQFVEQFRIVDIGNRPFVIRTTDFGGPSPYEIGQGVTKDPLRHETDQATLHGMIDSIAVSDATAP